MQKTLTAGAAIELQYQVNSFIKTGQSISEEKELPFENPVLPIILSGKAVSIDRLLYWIFNESQRQP